MKRHSSFRNRGLQVTNKNTRNSNVKIRQSIDSMLHTDYQKLKKISNNNYNQKSFLSCGTCSNNPLIMEYIRTIYHQYGIPDPMQNYPQKITSSTNLLKYNHKEQNFLQKSSLIRQKNRSSILNRNEAIKHPQKSIFFNNQSRKSEQNYYPNHNNQRKYDKNQIKFEYSTPRKDQSTFLYTSMDRPQTYNSKNLFTGQNSMYITSQDIKFLMSPKIKNSKHIRSFSVHQQISKSTPKIKDSYRYCIVCEQPILQINIQSHEAQCNSFNDLYRMNLQQIVQYLSKKIQKIREQLKQKQKQIKNQDPKNLSINIDNVLDKSLVVLRSGQKNEQFNKNYDQAMNISNRWGKTAQQINKLRWFLRIREQIKIHFRL